MGVKNIRLASMLSFDEQQEAEIIKLIEDFNSSHKMGEFVSNLIRIAVENPEIVVAKNGKYETGAVVKLMERLGKTPTRNTYMQSVGKQVADMQAKIDAIYEMCMKMYTMAELGKTLGFEKKTENMIIAEFMLEQQFIQLKNNLGVDNLNKALAANRIEACDKKAADTLEYILSCYEPIIAELKKEMTVKPLEIPVKPVEIQVNKVEQPIQQAVVQPTVVQQPIVRPVVHTEEHKESRKLNIKPAEVLKEEDDPIDFSKADTEALGNFFGD